jgi:hypothetical protein
MANPIQGNTGVVPVQQPPKADPNADPLEQDTSLPPRPSILQQVDDERKKRREAFKTEITDDEALAYRQAQTDPKAQAAPGDSVTTGIGAGLIRAPAMALGGTLDFAGDVGNIAGTYINNKFYRGEGSPTARAITQWVGESPVGQAWASLSGGSGGRTKFGRTLSGGSATGFMGDGFSKIGNDGANEATAQVGAVIGSFLTLKPNLQAVTSGLKGVAGVAEGAQLLRTGSTASKVAGVAGAAVEGVIAETIVTDPDQERLANIARDYFGWEGPIVDFLALDEEDGVLERRLSVATEGALLGTVFEGVLRTAKIARALFKGDHAGAKALGEEQIAQMAEEAGVTPADIKAQAQPSKVTPDGDPELALEQNLDTAWAKHRTDQEAALEDLKIAMEDAADDPENVMLQRGLAEAQDTARHYGVADEAGAPIELTPPQSTRAMAESAGAGGPSSLSKPVEPGAEASPVPGSANPTSGVQPVQEGAGGTQAVRGAATRRESILKSVNDALARAKLPEIADADLRITGTGKVIAPSEEAYLALKDVGLGDAFTTAKQAADAGERVLLKEDVAGTTRIVGDVSREDLARFQSEVRLGLTEGEQAASKIDYTNTGQLTLTFGDADGLNALVKATMDGLPAGAKRIRNDADLALASRDLADAMGTDAGTVRAWADSLGATAETMDVAMKALETVYTRSVKALDGMLGKDWLRATDEEFKAGALQVHNALTLAYQVSRVKSGLGRSLRLRQLPDADTYIKSLGGDLEAQRIAAVARQQDGSLPALPRSKEELQNWLDTFKDVRLGDYEPSGIKGGTKLPRGPHSFILPFLEDLVQLPKAGKYLRTSFANFFSASILSGFRTITLNEVAPTVLGAYRTMEKSMGSAVRAVIGVDFDAGTGAYRALSSQERVAALQSSADAWRAYSHAATQIPVAFRYAVNAFKSGNGRLGSGVGLKDVTQDLFVNLETAAKGGATGSQQTAYMLGNLVNWWPRKFGKVATSLDEFSNTVSYAGEVAWRALDEANALGLRGAEKDAHLAARLQEGISETGRATNDNVLREAQRTTLTSKVQRSAGPVSALSGAVNTMRREVPELRYILPIWNVPANGLGETLRRTPLGVFYKRTQEELLGKLGSAAQAEAFGRMTLATGLLMWTYHQARSGMVTGPGPKDPKLRAIWLQEHQPYSIRFPWAPDQWVDYSKFDVVGSLIGVSSALYDTTIYRDYGNENKNVFASAVGALAEYMRDKAALEQMSTLMSLDETNASYTLETFAKKTSASFIPAPLRDMRNLQAEGRISDKHTFADYFMDSIPFAYQAVPAKYDVLGRPVHGARDTLVENILPLSIKSAKADDPVISELVRLGAITGTAVGMPTAQTVNAGGSFDPRSVRLEDGKGSLIEEFAQVRGRVKINGQTLGVALQEAIDSPQYQQAVDADASKLSLTDGRESRTAILGKVFTEYNKEAKAQLARESETAARYMAFGKIRSGGSIAVEQLKATDVVNDPSLLNSLDINLEDYVQDIKNGG